jgi:hypothetical protein
VPTVTRMRPTTAHGKQADACVEPDTATKVCRGQAWHVVAPRTSAKNPAGHGWHSSPPALKVPMGHASHPAPHARAGAHAQRERERESGEGGGDTPSTFRTPCIHARCAQAVVRLQTQGTRATTSHSPPEVQEGGPLSSALDCVYNTGAMVKWAKGQKARTHDGTRTGAGAVRCGPRQTLRDVKGDGVCQH